MKWILHPLRLSTTAVLAAALLALFAPAAVWLRLVVGLPLVVLLPGYAIVAAFDPEHELGFAERSASSIVLSIVLTIACGMLLAISPLKLSTAGSLLVLGVVTIVGNAIASHRAPRGRLAQPEHPVLEGGARRAFTLPVIVIALGLAAALLVVAGTVRSARFTPSSGELVQLWMLPDNAHKNGGVEIGVDNRISTTSRFTLQYFQGSVNGTDTAFTLNPGASRLFTRPPLLEATVSVPPMEAELRTADGGGRTRSVSWWPR